MNNYSYVQLYYITLYANVNIKVKKSLSRFAINRKGLFVQYSILLSDDTVFADVSAIILARLTLTLTLNHFAVLVLVKLQIAIIHIFIFVIIVIPAGIA